MSKKFATSLEQLQVYVDKMLQKKQSPDMKREMINYIGSSIEQMKRLMVDITNPQIPVPYYLNDKNEAIELDTRNPMLSSAMYAIGINSQDNIYRALVQDLIERAKVNGSKMKCSRYTHFDGKALRISCGSEMVVVSKIGDDIEIMKVPNGTNAIFFHQRHSFPAWEPDTTYPTDPFSLQIFRPILETPKGVDKYHSANQVALLRGWLMSAMMNSSELPFLLLIGQKGSGKSTLAKAIVALFHGESRGLATAPNNSRDFVANATNSFIYAIDNLDSEQPAWFTEKLATASTGGAVQERKLFTDGELYTADITAKLMITSRTAAFANSPDVVERILPIFFAERTEYNSSGSTLVNDVLKHRSKILTYLALETYKAFMRIPNTSVSNRFVGFTRMVLALDKKNEEAIKALDIAQILSTSENNPLLRAIMEQTNGISGTPTEIVKQLQSQGFAMPNFGGGKVISNLLKEIKNQLKKVNWTVVEKSWGNGTHFTFTPPNVSQDTSTSILTEPLLNILHTN